MCRENLKGIKGNVHKEAFTINKRVLLYQKYVESDKDP